MCNPFLYTWKRLQPRLVWMVMQLNVDASWFVRSLFLLELVAQAHLTSSDPGVLARGTGEGALPGHCPSIMCHAPVCSYSYQIIPPGRETPVLRPFPLPEPQARRLRCSWYLLGFTLRAHHWGARCRTVIADEGEKGRGAGYPPQTYPQIKPLYVVNAFILLSYNRSWNQLAFCQHRTCPPPTLHVPPTGRPLCPPPRPQPSPLTTPFRDWMQAFKEFFLTCYVVVWFYTALHFWSQARSLLEFLVLSLSSLGETGKAPLNFRGHKNYCSGALHLLTELPVGFHQITWLTAERLGLQSFWSACYTRVSITKSDLCFVSGPGVRMSHCGGLIHWSW